MPKVTNIKVQAKNKDRISIFADSKYVFSLSYWQLSKANLTIGMELSNEQIEKLKHDSDFGKLHDRTYNWLLIRPRSAWEVEQYLAKKASDEQSSSKLIEKFKEKGLINDEEFARRWVENRRLLKPMSKLKLRQELIQKRVPKEIITMAITADEADELEVLKELIIKKRRITRYQDDKKLMEYLARQGFMYGDIKEAFEQLKSESQE